MNILTYDLRLQKQNLPYFSDEVSDGGFSFSFQVNLMSPFLLD